MTIWRIRIACWIPKATNTHSQYVILIVRTLQQWLYEHAAMLCYTYIASLVANGEAVCLLIGRNCLYVLFRWIRNYVSEMLTFPVSILTQLWAGRLQLGHEVGIVSAG